MSGLVDLTSWGFVWAFAMWLGINVLVNGLLKFVFRVGLYPFWFWGVNFGILFLTPFLYNSTKLSHEKNMEKLLVGFGSAYGEALHTLGLSQVTEDTPADDPTYLRMIDLQKAWVENNPEIADVYVFSRNKEGKTILLVDAETDYDRNGLYEEGRESRSEIGEVYEKDADAIYRAFMGKPLFQGNPITDARGTWVKSYTPIRNSEGEVYGVLGIDYSAEEYLLNLAKAKREVFWVFVSLLVVLNTSFAIFKILTGQLRIELRLQQVLNASRARAQESAKLVSLGEMASGVAHEVNNPLAIIVGKTEQMLRAIDENTIDPKRFKDSLEKIVMMTDRIARIVRGLRVFSQDASQEPYAPKSLQTVIEFATGMITEKFRSFGVELIIEPIPENIFVNCRSVEISQVLLNLLSNSFDALKAKSEKWVKIRVESLDQSVLVRVTDSGLGIPPEVSAKIMTPFFTTKGVGKGTGLGLSTSAGIMIAHGGRLYLEKDSKNTEFVLEFPRAVQSEEPQKAA
jgi:signal transduction histidine kinase